jgi:hypothetical protein
LPGRFKNAIRRWFWPLAVLPLLALVARDFLVATTFLGDDYVFLAYARLEPSPLAAFFADKHGGEYYRPIPMALWWLLDHLGGGRAWPFAAAACALHLLCGALVAGLGRALGLRWQAAGLAGALFFAAPAEREAALWFSASTDLLSTAALLAALVAFLRPGRAAWWASLAFAGVAFWCKETAMVLPALLLAAARVGEAAPPRWWPCLRRVLPHAGLAAAYLAVRLVVLHGWGGTNNPEAPWWAMGIQLAACVVHAVTAYAPLPEAAAWIAGLAAIAVAGVLARGRATARFALVWLLVTLLPLPAAGWVVGARYFYLPAVGLMLLVAAALEGRQPAFAVAAVAALLGLGIPSTIHRTREIALYRSAVAAAGAAVGDGLARGHRCFLVRGGVKDLDLAVKLARPGTLTPAPGYVVLADVPASFVWLPPELGPRLQFLLAEPPLPPSGAYLFGDQRIAGQARRDDAPDLDQVFDHLPELRIIHLRRSADRYTWEDRTADYRP